MARVATVDTLFLHERDGQYRVVVSSDGTRLLHGVLELKEVPAGPRPRRLRVRDGSSEDRRGPEQFVELARRADRIHISEQTAAPARAELREMLAGYQLEATVVRTCRYCADAARYSPLTAETAIAADDESICPDCARAELSRDQAFEGVVPAEARDRLETLLLEVRDLDRVRELLGGTLDPELTKFDEIQPTLDDVEPVSLASLPLHPTLQERMGARFETLLPVQSLAVKQGLLDGADQLVVSATATGKTLVGELAGMDAVLRGEGTMLFLVPLVALANQKFESFQERYGDLVDVTLRVGASRIGGGGSRFDPSADVIVGTYEGIDHALRTGTDLGRIATVVIDEVHNVADDDRGHRLDGLIARLKHYCGAFDGGAPGAGGGDSTRSAATRSDATDARSAASGTQWIYLSATVGNPAGLAGRLGATLVEFEERPVPIERHVTFADGLEKPAITNELVKRAYDSTSSKGYRGQTIVFTNSRRRCHEISRKLEYAAAPYHAGLEYDRRSRVERRFADQDLAAVVTTAALAAGVDFPASQVVFDSLAMGIEWLTVGEFSQMLGRAGRPDFHDEGRVYLLVEPDGRYHGGMDRTEDEVAFALLEGEMEPVVSRYDQAAAVEETLANVVVAGSGAKRLNDRMVGDLPTKHALGKLLEYEFIDGLEPTPLGRAVTRFFLSPDQAFTILDGIRAGADPTDVVAELELAESERA